MNKLIVLAIFIGLLATGCTAASNQKTTKYESFEEDEPTKTYSEDSQQTTRELSDLTNRIEALERNFIDVRMDYISRINNLEVEIAELKEESAMGIRTKKSRTQKKHVRTQHRTVTPKAKPTIITGSKKVKKGYDAAIVAYKNGDFSGSLEILNNLIIGETKKTLQDNIYYWRGMSQFQLSQYGNAIKNFTTVVEHFPKENKYYDSKLMVAISHGMMGDKSLSINELTRLLEENIPSEIRGKANKAIQEFQR